MVYLENFQIPNEDRRVYPYHLLSMMGLEHIEFAPITILYGNNGSGKSTILNMIAERLEIRDMTLGNTNEYFSSCVRKCTYTLGGDGVPDDSMMIRSEDIMHYISNIRKRNADIDKVVQGWLRKGVDKSIKGTLEAEHMVKQQFETLYDHGGGNSSFHAVMANKLAEKIEEESNGETAISYFKDRLFGDNLYLLDEPEIFYGSSISTGTGQFHLLVSISAELSVYHRIPFSVYAIYGRRKDL